MPNVPTIQTTTIVLGTLPASLNLAKCVCPHEGRYEHMNKAVLSFEHRGPLNVATGEIEYARTERLYAWLHATDGRKLFSYCLGVALDEDPMARLDGKCIGIDAKRLKEILTPKRDGDRQVSMTLDVDTDIDAVELTFSANGKRLDIRCSLDRREDTFPNVEAISPKRADIEAAIYVSPKQLRDLADALEQATGGDEAVRILIPKSNGAPIAFDAENVRGLVMPIVTERGGNTRLR